MRQEQENRFSGRQRSLRQPAGFPGRHSHGATATLQVPTPCRRGGSRRFPMTKFSMTKNVVRHGGPPPAGMMYTNRLSVICRCDRAEGLLFACKSFFPVASPLPANAFAASKELALSCSG